MIELTTEAAMAWVYAGIALTVMWVILGYAWISGRKCAREHRRYERVRVACRERGMSPPNPPRHDGLPDDYPCGGYFHEEVSVFDIDPNRRYR